MANSVKEQNEVGILVETTWGTIPAGNIVNIEVDPGTWINDVVDEYRDNMVRNGIAGMDMGSHATVTHAEGTLSGHFTPIMPFYLLAGIIGGADTQGDINTSTNAAALEAHDIAVSSNSVRSFGIQTSDGVDATQYHGMMPTSFEISSKQGEGAVTWSCDFIGKGGSDPTTAAHTHVENTTATAVPYRPLVGRDIRIADIGGAVNNRLLEVDITISREIELNYASGIAGIKYPNIRSIGAPQVTFRALVEFQLQSDIQLYSKGVPDELNAQATASVLVDASSTQFDEAFHDWHFRWANDPDVTTALTPAPTTTISATQNSTIGDQYNGSTSADDCVLDIYFDKVSLAGSPVQVDRSASTATFEFNGIALYNAATSRLGVFRIINKKGTAYSANDQ